MTSSDQPGRRYVYDIFDRDDTILSVAWSPDGETLAVGYNNGLIKLWLVRNGRRQLVVRKHEGPIRCLTWLTTEVIASGSNDQTICIWNVKTGETKQVLAQLGSSVSGIAWSKVGSTYILAVGMWDTTIRLWQLGHHGFQVFDTIIHHSNSVHDLAWLVDDGSDRALLASCSADATICTWEIGHTQRPRLINTLSGHREAVRGVVWVKGTRRIASCSDDSTIRLWDIDTGREVSRLEGHTGSIFGISVTPDGEYLASKSDDGSVRIWHLPVGVAIDRMVEAEKSSEQPSWLAMYPSARATFSPNMRYLTTLSQTDTAVRLWEIDFSLLKQQLPVDEVASYTNAKVVLLALLCQFGEEVVYYTLW